MSRGTIPYPETHVLAQSFRPWVLSANFGGSCRPDFFSPSGLGLIGRTNIWLFDEESGGVIDCG